MCFHHVTILVLGCVVSQLCLAGEPAKAPAPKADAKAPAAPPKVADPADAAPVKNLDEGGVLFSPTIAKNVRKYLQTKAGAGKDKHEVIFVGPGVAALEKSKLMPPSGSGWTYKAGPESVTQKSVTGLDLMEELPSVLTGFKPGIVVLVGVAGRPKISATEKQDWCDAAMICLRYGAIPIYAVPAADSDDDPLRWSLRGASVTVNVPAVDSRVGPFAERLPPLIKLIEQYVYGVVPGAKVSEPVEE